MNMQRFLGTPYLFPSMVIPRPLSTTLFRSAFLISTALVLFIPIRSLHDNYIRWLNLGPGGAPYNLYGWFKQWWLYPGGLHDETSVWPYSHPRFVGNFGTAAKTSYLKRPLPWREPNGHRPFVDCCWTVPQRQESGSIPVDSMSILEARQNLLEPTVALNPDHLRIATSALEGRQQAIFLANGLEPAPWAINTKGEIAHTHANDASSHVSLTPADAMEVVEKGWGQRHPRSHNIHIGFTFLYAPRTEIQVQVVRDIYEAACAAMVAEARKPKGM